jgi:ring-1,2-phenylacetyl-CoA epoxidase subunit PaaD
VNNMAARSLESLDAVWQLLEHIPDPEIPVVSIRELGILRDVRRNAEGAIEVVITPTYSGCPAIGQMEDDIHAALEHANLPARIVTQLAPAWTTDWMTASAHQKLREYGIAPPQHLIGHDSTHIDNTNNTNVIRFTSRSPTTSTASTRVPCPRCASSNTTETSHFASTACKALYKCLDCLEPFDYFKPY